MFGDCICYCPLTLLLIVRMTLSRPRGQSFFVPVVLELVVGLCVGHEGQVA
jgi:hypothetical protein